MSEELVLAERRAGVLVLTLNRPDRLNAWNATLEDEYFAALDAADDDPAVKAVVLTGAGRGFCAGADMADLARVGELNGAPAPPRPLPRHHPLAFRKPLIAAINGAAAGLGLVEALYCDVRFATPSAKLTTAFSRRGLIAEYGIAWLLPQLVGRGRALDLLMSGRIVSGREAYRIGLVEFLAEPDALLDAAVEYATDLAQHVSPWSISTIKAQLLATAEQHFDEAVADADRFLLDSFARPDVLEGVAAYAQRRLPDFPGLPARRR